MKTKRRITLMVTVFALVAMCISGVAALADNTVYDTGSLTDTGQDYNRTWSINQKELYYNWKIKCTNIDGSRGAGISFQPYNYTEETKAGGSIWISEEVDYTYVSYSGMDIDTWYELYARIDDDYAGPMDAQGKWNAN